MNCETEFTGSKKIVQWDTADWVIHEGPKRKGETTACLHATTSSEERKKCAACVQENYYTTCQTTGCKAYSTNRLLSLWRKQPRLGAIWHGTYLSNSTSPAVSGLTSVEAGKWPRRSA